MTDRIAVLLLAQQQVLQQAKQTSTGTNADDARHSRYPGHRRASGASRGSLENEQQQAQSQSHATLFGTVESAAGDDDDDMRSPAEITSQKVGVLLETGT